MEENNIEQAETDTRKNSQLLGKVVGVTVPPKYTMALALAGLGRYYYRGGTSFLPTAIGGLIGYVLGSKFTIDPNEQKNTYREMIANSAILNQNKQGSAPASGKIAGIMSASDLLNYSYATYPFTDKWGAFVGQPSVNFHAMVFGRPKQGKSILCVQWAKYLSENFGKVLYIASEEGFSVTLQKKVMDFAMDNPNLDFANFRNFTEIKAALKRGNYRFVFIDSVNYIRITPDQVEELKAENKSTAFITIQQATKGGQFRGSQEFAHNCDIIIQVEAGIAHQQGRFSEPTEMAVFEQAEEQTSQQKTPMLGGESQLSLFEQEASF